MLFIHMFRHNFSSDYRCFAKRVDGGDCVHTSLDWLFRFPKIPEMGCDDTTSGIDLGWEWALVGILGRHRHSSLFLDHRHGLGVCHMGAICPTRIMIGSCKISANWSAREEGFQM